MGKSSVIIKCKDCGDVNIHAKGMCMKCYSKKYRIENLGNRRRYTNKNRERITKQRSKYYKENKENNLIKAREYREVNRERLNVKAQKYRETYKEKINAKEREHRYENGGTSMIDNKTCSLFLGVHVAERILSMVFKDVERMPHGHIGYDFICNKGMKVDVKSSCLLEDRGYINTWKFSINKNQIADYFLCIAFDNRDDLNPLHLWLIPGNVVNLKKGTSISKSTLSKWKQYEIDINEVLQCCDTIKEIKCELIL